MADHVFPTRRTARTLRRLVNLLACACLCSAVGCDRKLSPEETSFYKRAEEVKVGSTLETVRRELGEPSRTLDAEGRCMSNGGRKEWVYDSFEAAGSRKPLRASSLMFCADRNGVVVAIFHIVT